MPLFRPGKPYRLLRLAGNTAIASGAQTIPFDTFEADGEFGLSTTGGLVEIAVAGLYLVVCNIRLTTGNPTEANVDVDGSSRMRQPSNPAASGSYVDQLEVGQQVEFRTFHSVARTLQAGPTNAAIVRIGPVRWT